MSGGPPRSALDRRSFLTAVGAFCAAAALGGCADDGADDATPTRTSPAGTPSGARSREVLLFHHAQGLTAGVRAFADELSTAGRTVHTPDLLDGRTFDTVEAGVAYARQVGFDEIVLRGARVAEALPADLVYVGFSLGAMPAQELAQTRAGARGALLVSGCVPVSHYSPRWPDGVPVQVHAMDADPWFVNGGDIDAARALVAEAEDAELVLYTGNQHLFADSSLPSYDPGAATLLLTRMLAFLDGQAR